jgi:hypothetical protein
MCRVVGDRCQQSPSSKLRSRFVFIAAVCCVGLTLPLIAQQTVTVTGTPQAITSGSAKLVAPFNPQQMLRLSIVLQPPHRAEEQEFVRELQDPASPNYRQFLSAAEWNARFAPSVADEQAVVTWAQSQGLTITQRYPNRLVVALEAPIATIQNAFDVTINSYQIGSNSYFSNDRDPSIPASLANIVQLIAGLNDIERAHTFNSKDREVPGPIYTPGPMYVLGPHTVGDANPTKRSTTMSEKKKPGHDIIDGTYEPSDIYSSYAYNYAPLNSLGHCCNPLNNSGASPLQSSIAVAIWGSYNESDLVAFAQMYGLAYNGHQIYIGGGTPPNMGEPTLDVEWATATANSFGSASNTAAVFSYEGHDGYYDDIVLTLQAALNDNNGEGYARVLNMSWGGAELSTWSAPQMTAIDNIFGQFVGQGWALVASAADNGATTDCEDHIAVSFPASDPNVTAVGGTQLTTMIGQYGHEVTWTGGPRLCADNDGGTGGGCSVTFANPSYQGSTACGSHRSVPDVALNSDWVNSPQVFFFDGNLYQTGGTSIAAPEISGFYAQENAYLLYLQSIVGDTCGPNHSAPCAPLGPGNPYVYDEGLNHFAPHYPFYDITSGCNNNNITQMYGLHYYCANAGFDQVTGWGSANMLQLAWMINYSLAGDGKGPAISITGPPVNQWYNTNQVISWELTDQSGNGHPPNGTSGFSAAWDVDPGDPHSEPTPGGGSDYYGPWVVGAQGQAGLSAAGQGCHNVYVRGWDNAGNSDVSAYGPLCFDNTPPVTTITLTGMQLQNGHYSGPVLVSVSATDVGCGVAATYYAVNGGNFQPYTAPFYEYLPQNYQISAYSVDCAGNQGANVYQAFDLQQNQQFPVTVTKSGTGSGTVTSSDGQINCGSTCTGQYFDEQPVTLTASAAQGSVFIGWQNCDLSFGLSCTATITQARTITAIFNLPVALQFVPVTPCRVVDTRGANGPFGGPTMQAGMQRSFAIPSAPNLTSCGDTIPPTAAAYSLNVTVVPQGSLNYLTAWPTGLTQPLTSTLNSYDGRVKANAAVVPAGSSESVSVYVTNTTDVIIDISGYFIPSNSSTLAFFPLPPCRIVDTRGPVGTFGGPYIPNQQTRDFPVLESPCLTTAQNAKAYSLNITALPHAPLGFLTVWPASDQMPVVSTLNAATGTVVANAAIVPAGTGGGGDIEVYPYGADTDLLIDINGYFAAPSSGSDPLSLYAFAPCRVLDTRQTTGAFNGELTVNVVGISCQAPSAAQAYVMNATVVPVQALGYLTLWADQTMQPTVSTLNAYDGAITSNMAVVPAGTNGKIDAYASDPTQLILDISSYLAP